MKIGEFILRICGLSASFAATMIFIKFFSEKASELPGWKILFYSIVTIEMFVFTVWIIWSLPKRHEQNNE